jgi:hypothetical protein
MAYNTSFDTSDWADFVVDFIVTDIDTGEDIDLTGATAQINIWEENCSPTITASIGSGITQPSANVLELTITAAQMAAFRPGSYLIGGRYILNGATTQIFRGDFVVYDGGGSV